MITRPRIGWRPLRLPISEPVPIAHGVMLNDPAQSPNAMNVRLRVLARSIAIVAAVSSLVMGIALYVLYQEALHQRSRILMEIVDAQARLIEAVARFDEVHSEDAHEQGAAAATIAQVVDAHAHDNGIGESGEFLLAQRRRGRIEFLLPLRHASAAALPHISLSADTRAEPMRRALLGESGTTVALDYRGVRVLAAYEPVRELDLGLVAKMDLAEVQQPFIHAAWVAGSLGLLLVIAGAVALAWFNSPIIRRLEESEQRFRSFVSNIPGISYRADVGEQGNILFVGGDSERLCGYSLEHFLKGGLDAFTKVVHPDDLERTLKGLEDTLTSGQPMTIEYRVVHRDGSVRWVRDTMQPVFDAQGTFRFHDGLLLDISDRKRAEHQLKASQKRNRALFDHSPVAIVLHDDSGLVDCNHRASSLFGYEDRDALRGVQPLDLAPKRQLDGELSTRKAARMTELALTNGSHRFEWHCLNRRGEVIPVEVTLTPTLIDNGKALLAVLVDLSEQKRSEQAMLAAMKEAEAANRAKSQFLSNMSHELRTPLNGVLGYAQILLRDPSMTQAQRESLSAIRNCGEHLLTLINDVLDLSKIEAGHLHTESTPVDLERLLESVHDVIAVRAAEKGIEFCVEVGPEVPRGVVTDGTKLKQVLVNLAGNAVKFTDRGRVDVQVSECSPGRFRFEVTDTGIGMSAEELEQVFDPFLQAAGGRAAGGTGLGLAISSRIIAAMGGTLEGNSTLGEGSRFAFELELEEIGAGVAAASEDSLADGLLLHVPEQREITVLIADDSEHNRDILQRLLEAVGIETMQAANGKQVLERLGRGHVDLVLMDVRMPLMNGLQATRCIRANPETRDLKIIAVSASVFANQQQRIVDAGCDDFIGKPLSASELYTKLAQHLNLQIYKPAVESDAQTQSADVVDLDAVVPILEQLAEAATIGDIETVKNLAQAMLERGGAARQIGRELSAAVGSFDLDRVRKIANGFEEASQ